MPDFKNFLNQLSHELDQLTADELYAMRDDILLNPTESESFLIASVHQELSHRGLPEVDPALTCAF